VFDHDNRLSRVFIFLDPAIAGGNVAAIVGINESQKAHVTIVRAFHPGDKAKPYEIASERDLVELPPKFWETGDFTVLVDRKLLKSPRIKSPDGKHRVELRGERITLTDAKGTERWTVPSRGATKLVWTPSGNVLAYGAGIAQLDLATGAIVRRQCGWRFGRWTQQPESSDGGAICQAP
jgi:hypothetical protein